MLKRIVVCTLTAAALLGAVDAAQAQGTFNFTVGGFVPKGEDARVEGDVLNANRTYLAFDLKDFQSATIGGELLFPFGNYFEGGAGMSFSRRTVPSVYTDFTDSDGTEIDQELRLRMMPIAFTVRILPLGQSSPVQPYFGAGLAIVNWRYSETGEFVDFDAGRAIFRDSFVATGNAPGAVALGGIRFAGDKISAGGEIRFQAAQADLDGRVFAGPKLDLGGWTYQGTIGIRF